MVRARLEPGQVGAVRFVVLATGTVQATAKMRDEMGELRRLKASGHTEEEARAEIQKQAELIRFHTLGSTLGKDATIEQACAVFMADKTAEGLVEDTTLETYQYCIDHVILPQCGSLRLRDLSVLRCNRIIQTIREEKSLSSARKAKSILSMVCAAGIEHEALDFNPVRDTRRLPLPEKKESALTPAQIVVVRDLIRAWRQDGSFHGPRPNVQLLENVMWIMVGTSCRIGDRITAHAREVGAKVVLVGDYTQLDAVDSGGAFALVAHALGDAAAELADVRRFDNAWERAASLRLRVGQIDVLQIYDQHDRLSGGEYLDMLDAAYGAWLADTKNRLTALMIAETLNAVAELNLRARLDRISTGIIDPAHSLPLHDGTDVASGDVVVTRHNDRRLRLGKTWVKNGDLWDVLAAHEDGSLTVTRRGRWGGAIRLPVTYVAEHVELGYAVTSHRAQGSTVDTTHVVVPSSQMTREAFYVAMTRGRKSNHAYVATAQPGLEEHQLRPDDDITAPTVLAGVLAHAGAELSVHETIRVEQTAAENIAQLAAEYDTITQAAQADRWLDLLEHSGLTEEQIDAIVGADSFGPLAAELRRADANHHDPEKLLPALIAERPIEDVDDIGAILRARLHRATTAPTGSTRRHRPRPTTRTLRARTTHRGPSARPRRKRHRGA